MPSSAGETPDIDPLEAAFIRGFREAADIQAFLRLAGVPFEIDVDGTGAKLVRLCIEAETEVGSTAPGFASRELVYHPLPHALCRTVERVTLVYLSPRGEHRLSLAAARDMA